MTCSVIANLQCRVVTGTRQEKPVKGWCVLDQAVCASFAWLLWECCTLAREKTYTGMYRRRGSSPPRSCVTRVESSG